MPSAEYETRTDSVLAWKKAQKLGRFNPDAPSIEQQKVLASELEIEERGKHFTSTFSYIVRPMHLPPGDCRVVTQKQVSMDPYRGKIEVKRSTRASCGCIVLQTWLEEDSCI